MMDRWWLSFADPNLPEGEQFLGVSIVEGGDFLEAVNKACELGINPGGEVLGYPLNVPESISIDEWFNKLLTKDEVLQLQKQFDQHHGQ